MKNKILFTFLTVSFLFIFVVFYKGLNLSNFYKPSLDLKKDIPKFSLQTLNKKELVKSENLFNQNKLYILNIWASWCVPCRDEHSLLMNLSKNEKIVVVGLNYKDNFNNAKKFIDTLGNPYSIILVDRDGTKSIEWGAFGVPETFIIYKNKIIKKYVGPLNFKTAEEIQNFLQ